MMGHVWMGMMVVIAQVLLGEGYYAERSAKQAAEILKRHSEFITTKIDGLKNQIQDLEAEASFAKETAAEAAVRVLQTVSFCGLSLSPILA